jgi:hypothetical protein
MQSDFANDQRPAGRPEEPIVWPNCWHRRQRKQPRKEQAHYEFRLMQNAV